MPKHPQKPPGQRQLRVGEEIRHALSAIFLENTLYEPELRNVSITVSEVRVSSDLKNATAYVTPLGGGGDKEKFIKALNHIADSFLRREVTARIQLKFSPQIRFALDQSFEVANRIETLLKEKPRNDKE